MYEDYPWLFVKFGEKQHLQELQHGNLYCGTAKYYRELEKKSHIKGVGDRYEGCKVYRDAEFIIDGYKFPKVDEILISNERDDRTPIFCFSHYNRNDFIKGSSQTDFKLNFTVRYWERIKDEFGEYALVFLNSEENNFVKIVAQYCKNKKINAIVRPVEYYNYQTGDRTWLSKYREKDSVMPLFLKDDFFSYQHEARFVFDGIYTRRNDSHILLKIKNGSNLSKFSYLLLVDELKELSLPCCLVPE